MYIYVKLLSGLPTPLWYRVPEMLQKHGITVGTIVQVPLRSAIIPAYVLKYSPTALQSTFAIKEIVGIQELPADGLYRPFIAFIAHLYQIQPTLLIQRLHQFLYQKEEKEPILARPATGEYKEIRTLSTEQQTISDTIARLTHKKGFCPILLHGVTGSGKTELYKKIITQTVAQQKTVILLLPEVTLATAFEERLAQELDSSIPIFGFHSGKTSTQKKALWQALIEQKAVLIIGVHLPILLPISNLGFIIIDEEHDTGFQEKRHPKINSKQAAIERARQYGIPILLGSATPSISTLYRVKQEKWHFFQLKKRFAGSFPTIQKVLLPAEKQHRKIFWITKELQNAIADRLAKKEQSIIFLNRRGYSFFVQCLNCTFIFNCDFCSVSLTLHENNRLTCHYCGVKKELPNCCPECKAPETQLLKKGIGTQQAVSLLEKMFPNARIARADMDTTSKKKEWKKIVADFSSGAIDILVGTQTITKGYHFANVTLVGIVWADLSLHFPQFNSAEVTVQQLIQVAGRAGRVHHQSTVIVQTMAAHPIFDSLNEIDYLQLYATEMAGRTALHYPPFYALVEVELKSSNEPLLEKEAYTLAAALQAAVKSDSTVSLLGPAKPLIHKIQNKYARTLFIKAQKVEEIIALFAQINKSAYKSNIFFTPLF